MQMNLITNYKEKIVLFSLRSLTIVFNSAYQTVKVSIMVSKATFPFRTEVFFIVDNNTEQCCSKKTLKYIFFVLRSSAERKINITKYFS